MKSLKEKQRAFLMDTVGFYNSTNRGTIGNAEDKCIYSAINKSPGCAIGRHLTKELAALADSQTKNGIGCIAENEEIYNQFPESIKELGIGFLQDVQELHDNSYYWTEIGLSEKGLAKVNRIINSFGL